MSSFGFPCAGDCECIDCNCTDPYNTPGTGGAGTACPFTGGGALVIAGGVLNGTAGTSIVFTNGPDDDVVSTTVLTIIAQPATSGGPSVIELRAGIVGAEYVYGRLTMSGSGDISISVGTNGGVLAERENVDSGGIAEFVTLELCWKPPVFVGDVNVQFYSMPYSSAAGLSGVVFSSPENILATDGITADAELIGNSGGAGSVSGSLTAFFNPVLPADATITSIGIGVNLMAVQPPEVVDRSADLLAGLVSLADKALGEAVPNGIISDMGYLWTGADLTGVTAAAINTHGIEFTATYEIPASISEGAATVSVDSIELQIDYTFRNLIPGRVTLRYTKGAVSECVTGSTTSPEGGGFPGLSFTTDNWQVTSTDIRCTTEECDICEFTPSDPCNSNCCLSGLPDVSAILSLGPIFDVVGTGSSCFPDTNTHALISFNGTPFMDIPCMWSAWIHNDIGSGNTLIPITMAYIAGDGINCFWEAVLHCVTNDEFGDYLLPHPTRPATDTIVPAGYSGVIAVYRGPNITADDCIAFPVTLNRTSYTNYGTNTVEPPTSLTLDETSP